MKTVFRFDIAFALLCVVCVSVFFVAAAISADLSVRERGISENVSTPEVEEKIQESMYTLMEHEGKVYVYSGGKPFVLTDIDPVGLPKADREKLKQGIGADSRETLLGLIEDFGS